MMDVSLVWADDAEDGLVGLAVDEEIDQLRQEIAFLRRELFVDDEILTAGRSSGSWREEANPLSTSIVQESPPASPGHGAEEEEEEGAADLGKLAAYASRGRVRSVPTPTGFNGTMDSLNVGWRELGRLVAQERGKAIDNAAALEWLCTDGRRLALLSFVFHEFDFSSLDVELAFRFFLERLRYLPKEGQKQARLISAFGSRYFFDCPTVVQSAEAATHLASGLFMLHTMLHHVAVAKDFAFDLQGWIDHNKGLNGGNDFDPGMLADAFANVRDAEFTFQDETQHGLEIVKHGWLEVREEKLRRHGSIIRRPPKLYWGEVADGTLYLLNKPGKLTDAAVVVPLASATLERGDVEADPAGTEGLSLQTEAGAFSLSFRSEWAVRSWAKCLMRNVDRPFPGIRVHDVPADVGRKSSLKVVPNPVFGVAAVAPLIQSQSSVVQVANPLYGNEAAQEMLSPKGTRIKKISNPVFNNESIEALISPRSRVRAGSNDQVTRMANPVFANGEVEDILSPSSEGREKKAPNPAYRKHRSHPDFSHHLERADEAGSKNAAGAAAKAPSPSTKKSLFFTSSAQVKSDHK